MKKLLSLILILISIISMNCSNPQVEQVTGLKADKQLAIKVDGMVCAMGCARYIEKKVANMNGVSNCTVNFEEGTASIEFSSEITAQEDIIETITGINEGQYKVTDEKLSNIKSNSSNSPTSNTEELDNETEVSFHFPELATYFLSHIISRS